MENLKIEINVGKVIFGIGTGVIPTVNFRVANENGMTVFSGNVEVSLEKKDYTVSELKEAATNQFYEMLKHILENR